MWSAKLLGPALLLAVLGLVSGSEAQGPALTSACQTQYGVCLAPVAPVGAPCVCGRGDPGRMIFAPQQAPQQQPPVEQRREYAAAG